MLSNILFVLVLITAGLILLIYIFMIRGPWPKRSKFTVNFDNVRELAHAEQHLLPTHINYEVIATGVLPSWGVVAGEFGKAYPIEFPSFQIVYKNKTVIIEVPFNRKLFEKFPFGKTFAEHSYEKMQKALLEADFIIPTHEHWDHLGGIAQSENLNQLLPKLIITKKQIDGSTIKDAEFPKHTFEHFDPLVYDKYHRVAPGIVLIDAPGHSSSHQLVYVKLQDHSEILFTGDIIWVTGNLKKKKARPWITNLKRYENRRQIAHQMRWLHDEFYTNEHQKIKMITTHDPEQHAALNENKIIHYGFQINQKT